MPNTAVMYNDAKNSQMFKKRQIFDQMFIYLPHHQ